jgi:hypothetical protein
LRSVSGSNCSLTPRDAAHHRHVSAEARNLLPLQFRPKYVYILNMHTSTCVWARKHTHTHTHTPHKHTHTQTLTHAPHTHPKRRSKKANHTHTPLPHPAHDKQNNKGHMKSVVTTIPKLHTHTHTRTHRQRKIRPCSRSPRVI